MGMLLRTAFVAAFLFALCNAENSWSWNKDEKDSEPQETHPVEDVVTANNATDVDEVIDSILATGRQGRNLQGYDEIYSDPSIQEVLQKGDDTDARNLIKDRLCSLGLMQCEDIEGKRQYISPEELVYAQPVDIKPIGRPIPSIPVKGPSRAIYGPPKPMPFPSKNGPHHGPPRRYGPPPPNKPFYGPPQHSKPPFPGPIVYDGPELSRPPFIESDSPPYSFESSSSSGSNYFNKETKKQFGVIEAPEKVQQHVHHHFHHNSDADGANKVPTVILNNPIPISTGSIQTSGGLSSFKPSEQISTSGFSTAIKESFSSGTIGGSYGGQSIANYGSSTGLGTYAGVKPVIEHSGPQQFGSSSGSSLYGSGSSQFGSPGSSLYGSGSNQFGSSGSSLYGSSSNSQFGSSGSTYGSGSSQFGSSGSSFGSGASQFTINPSYGSGGSQFGSGSSFSGSNSGSNFGSSSGSLNSGSFGSSSFGGGNSFGASVGSFGSSGFYKKELNVNGGIQSNHLTGYGDKYQGLESARAENFDCVCVPYDQCPSQDIIGRKDDLYLALDPRNIKTDIEAEEAVITDGNGTMTVVRVAKDTNSTKLEEEPKEEVKKVSKREAVEKKEESKPEARQSQYNNNKNIKPTFGISFGLPNQGGQYAGYPVNPINPHSPIVNPYGGNGINLGLVSVNPLVSVQLTKDDYGEKIVKPFVNLHVTPNDFLVHKFADFFSYKKHYLYNQHQHYHKHTYKPHYPHHHHKPIYEGPPIFEGPIHGPSHFEKPYYDEPYLEKPHFDHFIEKPHFEPHFQPHSEPHFDKPYYDDFNYGSYNNYDDGFYGRAAPNVTNGNSIFQQYEQQYDNGQNAYGSSYNKYLNHQAYDSYGNPTKPYDSFSKRGGKSLSLNANPIKFPSSRRRRDVTDKPQIEKRQAFYGNNFQRPNTCGPRHVCCRRPLRPHVPQGVGNKQCGTRHSQGINGRIKNPVYVDGDSEFGEYPWQVAILKKDPKESVYVCGGTLIDAYHLITAAHCIKTYSPFDLRVRLGEWDVNHDVEFFPYIERDVTNVHVHPEFYAGTLYNDLAIVRMDKPVDFNKYPHIAPACLPSPHDDYQGTRCWTTGWGKDAFGDFGKYQNILKEVDVPIIGHGECQQRLQHTRLGREFKLHPGFVCAGGEEGKDACKGDGGGPMVCERGGSWQVVGVVSWGIGCGQPGVPGVYVKVSQYLDWIRQITQRF